MTYIVALICVAGIAAGQILFKLSATQWHDAGTLFAPKPATTLFIALALYGLTTLGWVWVLQKAELGKIYPLMALAFAIVPIGSYWVFGERFNLQYVMGVLLIIGGIILTARG